MDQILNNQSLDGDEDSMEHIKEVKELANKSKYIITFEEAYKLLKDLEEKYNTKDIVKYIENLIKENDSLREELSSYSN